MKTATACSSPGVAQAAQAARRSSSPRASEAHNRLAETAAAHAAELERIREESQARITTAEEDRDSAIEQARAAAGLVSAPIAPATRRSRRPRRLTSAAIAEARADAAGAETTRAREDAARELEQLRARAERAERDLDAARAERARLRQ
jgi:hypothetical protein